MKQASFSVKDLVNAGLFSLLIVIVSFVSGMIGFLPITMPIVPFFGALMSGPLFMLYSTKIRRFGMVLVMGLVSALVFVATGHTILIVLGTVLAALLGEYILKRGDYRSIKHARWAYVAYSLSSCANLLPIYLMPTCKRLSIKAMARNLQSRCSVSCQIGHSFRFCS